VLDKAIARGEATYERPPNDHDEATLVVELNVHSEATYERPANTRDQATLAAKLKAHSEASYERPASHAVKKRSKELAVKRWAVSLPPDGASMEPKGKGQRLSKVKV